MVSKNLNSPLCFQLDNDDEVKLNRTSLKDKANWLYDQGSVIVNHSSTNAENTFTAGTMASKDGGGNYLSTEGPDHIKDYDELCKILHEKSLPKIRSIIEIPKLNLSNKMHVGVYLDSGSFEIDEKSCSLIEKLEFDENEKCFVELFEFVKKYFKIFSLYPEGQFVLFVENKQTKVIKFLGVFYIECLESLRVHKIVLCRVGGPGQQLLRLDDLSLWLNGCPISLPAHVS